MSSAPPYDVTSSFRTEIFGKIIWEMDDGIIAVSGESIITFCNPAIEKLFGYSQAQLIGQRLEMLLPERYRRDHSGHVGGFLKGKTDTSYMGSRNSHLLGLKADGTEVRLGSTILRTQTSRGPVMVAVVRDISERVAYQAELERLANTDPLTGLHNRRAFMEKAGQHLDEARNVCAPLSILLFDIDHFKRINDTHGHDVGDRVLTDFAGIISSVRQGADIIARWGGEEFIVMMPGSGLDRAVLMGEMVRRYTEVLDFGAEYGESLSVTVSVGVAATLSGEESLKELVKRADEALYAAKGSGRNMVSALMPHWQAPTHFALRAAIG